MGNVTEESGFLLIGVSDLRTEIVSLTILILIGQQLLGCWVRVAPTSRLPLRPTAFIVTPPHQLTQVNVLLLNNDNEEMIPDRASRILIGVDRDLNILSIKNK